MRYAGLVAGRPGRKSGFFAALLAGVLEKPGQAVVQYSAPPYRAPPQGVFQPQRMAQPAGFAPVAAGSFANMHAMARTAGAATPPPVAVIAPAPRVAAALPSPATSAVPTATRLLSMQWLQRQQKLVADVNTSLGPASSVMAWSVLPATVFEGDAGRFLMLACDMFAGAPANTMLLPVMPSGCEALNLPRHPLASAVTLQLQAQHKITSLYRQAQDDHKRAAQALQAGDASAVFSSSARHSDYQRQIAQIIRDTAEQVLGRDAVDRHETRFRSLISKM